MVDVRYWHKADVQTAAMNVCFEGDCVAKLTAPSVGLGVSEWGALIARPPSGGSVADIFDELSLRSAGGWRHRRWSSDILGELSQVLGGGDEQNLVAAAAQAPRPQPVELQDALHVGKQHLDFLALSARLLEGLGVGQHADAIAQLLVDVSRDLAHGPDGALGLQRAG